MPIGKLVFTFNTTFHLISKESPSASDPLVINHRPRTSDELCFPFRGREVKTWKKELNLIESFTMKFFFRKSANGLPDIFRMNLDESRSSPFSKHPTIGLYETYSFRTIKLTNKTATTIILTERFEEESKKKFLNKSNYRSNAYCPNIWNGMSHLWARSH